jgi:hypothetical protein
MSDTIACPTCGGSGDFVEIRYSHFGDPPEREISRCPDCIRGRQPTPEVLERMAKVLAGWVDENDEREAAKAAWLAEHREET